MQKQQTTIMAPVETFTMPLNTPACRDIATALDSTVLLTTNDPHRETLRHILIEMTAKAWTFTATDSYAVAQVTVPAPVADGHPQPAGSFLMHRDTAKAWSKALKARTTMHARLDVTDDDLALAINNNGGFTTRRTHHDYPNYHTFFLDDVHAWPMTTRYEPALWALDANRLANLCKSAAAIAPKEDVRLDNVAHHPLKASYWAANAAHIEWTGLLMPVRIA